MSDSEATANSKLGKGSEARGRLSGSGSMEIHGALGGEVDWQGLLLIGVDGRLVADGRVGTLDLRGILEGRLDVTEEVLVRRGARWAGGCATPSMSTEAGAWIEGEFRVRPPEAG